MSNFIDTKRFIFTGAPGSGKTSVIQELEKLGHVVIHESATDFIAQEQTKGNMRPWEQANFVDKIILMQKTRQMNAHAALQFHDRSVFCSYALSQYLSYTKNIEFIPSNIILNEIDRCLKSHIYQHKVFFFENLGFIARTSARTISYEHALIFEKIHLDVYKKFGFEIIMVPKKQTIEQRCIFILEKAL